MMMCHLACSYNFNDSTAVLSPPLPDLTHLFLSFSLRLSQSSPQRVFATHACAGTRQV